MHNLLSFSLLVLHFICTCNSQTTVEFSNDFSIRQSSPGTISKSKVVYGAKSCGGQGRMVQMRFESCSSSSRTCKIPGDGALRKGELDFIPGRTIEQLGVRMKLAPKGFEPQTIYEGIIPNSSVTAGVKYTGIGYGAYGHELKDSRVTIQCILFEAYSGREEVCMIADFDIV